MAKQLQLRRGTTAQHSTFTGAVGEITVDTDKDVVVVHDGATAGGFPSQKELVSGTNIKTINSTSLLGSGNIDVIQTVTNIDEMKDFVAPYDNYALNVLGYSEAGDGGGGLFYWDATSTETDNGGTIIQATGITTGRWKRVFSGAVNVKWFGAVGLYNGTTHTEDDTAAIQATIDYAKTTGAYVFAPVGVYKLTSAITIDENVRIYGENYKRYRDDGNGYTNDKTVFNQTVDSECIVVPNNTINWSLDGIEFAYNGTGSSTKAAVSVQTSNSFTLSNLTFKAFKYAYLANNTWSVTITNIYIYECDYGLFFGTPGSVEKECGTSQTVSNVWVLYPGIEAYSMYGLHYSSFTNCCCDHVDTGATVFKIYNSPSVSFYNCAAEDFTGGAVMSATESMCTFIGMEVLFFTGNSTATTAFNLSGKHSFINCSVRQTNLLSPAPGADWWTFVSQARLGTAPDGTTKSVINIQGNETLGLTGCKLRSVLFVGADSEIAGIYSSSLVYDGAATTYNALVATSGGLIRPNIPLTFLNTDLTTIGNDIRSGDFGVNYRGLGVQIGSYYYNLNDVNVHLLLSATTWATLAPCTSYISFNGIYPFDAAASVPAITTNFFKIGSISTNPASPTTVGSVSDKTIQLYNDNGVLKVKHNAGGQNYTFVYSINVV